MMTREEIRELASFEGDEKTGIYPLSFYFQPDPPQDRSHRRETIAAKDALKQAFKEANGKAKNPGLSADIERVLEVAGRLPGHTRARAIFACSAKNLWKEFDLPPRLTGTGVYIQPRLHLKPLAMLLGAYPDLCDRCAEVVAAQKSAVVAP